MNKLFFLMLGLFIFSFAFVSAESIGTFKQGETINISNFCQDGGCTGIDLISITYPDGTTEIINGVMIMNGQEGFYEWNDTTALGTYNFRTTGSNGITNLDTFKITSNGVDQTSANSIGSLAFLVLMVVLMLVFGIVGFKLIKHETLWILGIFLIFFAVLLMIYNTWLGYEYHRLLTGLPDSSVPETIFYILLLILVLGLLTSVALLILNWKKIFKYIKREIKKKETDDRDVEDWDFDGNNKGGSYGS